MKPPPFEHITSAYPFGEAEDPVEMDLKLFSGVRLRQELESLGMDALKVWTVHSVTCLIPSTILDMNRPPKNLVRLFRFLSRLEELSPLTLPGRSLVFLLEKRCV